MLRHFRDGAAIAALTALGAAFVLAALVVALARWIGPLGALGLTGAVFLAVAAALSARRIPQRPPAPEPVTVEALSFVLGFVAIRALLRRS